jgi:hypothetical protein
MRTLEHADILSRSKVQSEAGSPESVTLSQGRPPGAVKTNSAVGRAKLHGERQLGTNQRC